MHVNLEDSENHTIQSYDEYGIQINNKKYLNSLVVSKHEIIPDWPVQTLSQLTEENLQALLKYNPNIILIGYSEAKPNLLELYDVKQRLERQLISLELTSIGAACRTFNILLSEHRDVALGIIL